MTKTKTPMTIGIFTDDFYPNSGGVGRSIELQATELAARGHRVILFAPNHLFIKPTEFESEALDNWHIPGTESFLCSLKFDNKLAERLAKQYPFDIVHTQNERGSLFLGAKIAKLLNIAHIHTFHSNIASTHQTYPILSAINTLTSLRVAPRILRSIRNDCKEPRVRYPSHLKLQESSKLAKLDWKAIATLASYVDVYTSPAQYMIDNVNESTHDRLSESGLAIPNGINSVFSRSIGIREDDTVRFLSCGRLDPEKRVDVIIRAFAKLPKLNTELYILGKGADEAKLKRLSHKLRPRNPIVFLGHYSDHERVANELANSDVFVLGSYRFDTQSMVLGEAASAGAAIIYCDDRLTVGVNTKNALLTKPSASAIFIGMQKLISDSALLETMKESSRQIAPNISQEKMANSYLSAYGLALKLHKKSTYR